MHLSRIAGSLLLAAALAAADSPFETARKALAETLKAKTTDAAALAKCDALVQQAGDDAQRATAITMLADACTRAGAHDRAAEGWGRLADLERARSEKDRAQRVWNAEVNRLRSFERQKPVPGKAMAERAQALLAQADPALTPQQQIEAAVFAAKGVAAAENPAAGAAWLAAHAAKTADPWLQVELQLQVAEAQGRANDPAAALATWTQVAANAAAKPEQRGQALLSQAQAHDRNRKVQEALALVPQLVTAFTQAAQAGWTPGWSALNGLRWSAQVARRQGDYALAEAVITSLATITKDPGQLLNAKQELAAVRCGQKRWADAEALYRELIAGPDARVAGESELALAFTVYRDQGDTQRGQGLVDAALANEKIAMNLRGGAVLTEARRILARGDRAGALAWFARIEKLPGGGPDQARLWSQALVEMGEIAESKADTAAAKGYYQKALDMQDGEIGARIRARNALEGIRYFE